MIFRAETRPKIAIVQLAYQRYAYFQQVWPDDFHAGCAPNLVGHFDWMRWWCGHRIETQRRTVMVVNTRSRLGECELDQTQWNVFQKRCHGHCAKVNEINKFILRFWWSMVETETHLFRPSRMALFYSRHRAARLLDRIHHRVKKQSVDWTAHKMSPRLEWRDRFRIQLEKKNGMRLAAPQKINSNIIIIRIRVTAHSSSDAYVFECL